MTKNCSKNVFLHICCAACASYVVSDLRKEDYEITGFFYHPEIKDKAEYKKRLKDVQQFCQEKEIELVVPEHKNGDFAERIAPFKDKGSIKYITDKDRYRRRRCHTCILLILSATFSTAKEMKFKEACTSMLCSPFRDHDEIWNIGDYIASQQKLTFSYKDFRKGYWTGRNFARNHGLNIPKFCGCDESLKEGLLE